MIKRLTFKKKNKKAQVAGIFAFVALCVGIFILAPIFLKIFNSLTGHMATQLQNQSTAAYNAIQYGQQKFNSLWDYAIIIAFLMNMILLLLSSFLIDIHPVFIVLYILSAFFLFILAPTYIQIIDKFWTDPHFTTEVANMPNTSWLYQNFIWVLLGIYFITGVIMFIKLRMGKQQQTPGGGYYG